MRPNPAKARPKKLKMASVADVGDDDLQLISEKLVGCYAALARGLVCRAAIPPFFAIRYATVRHNGWCRSRRRNLRIAIAGKAAGSVRDIMDDL